TVRHAALVHAPCGCALGHDRPRDAAREEPRAPARGDAAALGRGAPTPWRGAPPPRAGDSSCGAAAVGRAPPDRRSVLPRTRGARVRARQRDTLAAARVLLRPAWRRAGPPAPRAARRRGRNVAVISAGARTSGFASRSPVSLPIRLR